MSDVSQVVEQLCAEFEGRVRSQAVVFAVTETRRALIADGNGEDIDLLREQSRDRVIDLVAVQEHHLTPAYYRN